MLQALCKHRPKDTPCDMLSVASLFLTSISLMDLSF